MALCRKWKGQLLAALATFHNCPPLRMQTHITRTQIISTDSYCYRTRSKTVPILSITLPNNLGPKAITEQCRRKRAIDTASIMGESEW